MIDSFSERSSHWGTNRLFSGSSRGDYSIIFNFYISMFISFTPTQWVVMQ